jgi:hypothetical protein
METPPDVAIALSTHWATESFPIQSAENTSELSRRSPGSPFEKTKECTKLAKTRRFGTFAQ